VQINKSNLKIPTVKWPKKNKWNIEISNCFNLLDEPSYSNQDPVVNNNYDYTNPDVPLQPESEYGGGYGGGYGDPYSGNNGYISDPCGVRDH
jgi:hypothetical protein